MRYCKSIIIGVSAVMALLACGGSSNNSDDPVIEGRTFNQTVTLPATMADTIMALTDLSTKIGSIENTNEWVTIREYDFSSGVPRVRIIATDNEADETRSCVVTITAESSDKVLLTINQEKAQMPSGIDDTHDVVTDQPASSRR